MKARRVEGVGKRGGGREGGGGVREMHPLLGPRANNESQLLMSPKVGFC